LVKTARSMTKPPTAEEKRMPTDQHPPPKSATPEDLLDPYAPGSGDEDEPVVDLSRDLSSDPNYDFAASGWTWVDDHVEPPDWKKRDAEIAAREAEEAKIAGDDEATPDVAAPSP
jgi:hypothetical protein